VIPATHWCGGVGILSATNMVLYMRYSAFLLLGLSGCAGIDCCQPTQPPVVYAPYSPPVRYNAPVSEPCDEDVVVSKPVEVAPPIPSGTPSPFKKDVGAPPLEPIPSKG
jgi:hypothetical protein